MIARWGGWIAWVTSTISGVTLVTIPFVFPDGRMRLPVRPAAPPVLAVPALVIALAMTLHPGPMVLLTSLDNPLGVGPRLFDALPPLALGGIAG